MDIRQILILVGIAALALIGIFLIAPIVAPDVIVSRDSAAPAAACGDACSLFIEPDDGLTPVLTALESAKKSIDLVMYELEDPAIESVLARARERGVAVRVLLSPGYEGEPSAANEAAYETLVADAVPVRWSPDYFALTHEKSFVVDGVEGIIMSFNLVPAFYPTGRDFGVIDRDANDVTAMEAAFDADWQGNGGGADPGDNLVWSPGSRAAILALINGATAFLDIYNEEMDDGQIMSALIAAALRGVTVSVDMTYSPDWKNAFQALVTADVSVRTYSAHASRYIHAKMIIADGTRAFVGSENFSAASLDHNRELGIMITDNSIIQSLAATFASDWQSATAFKER